MENKKVLVFAAILTLVWILSLPSARADSTLQIALFGSREANIKTFQPFDIWLEVVNPDSDGHSYRILVSFEDYQLSENGYVNASGFEIIYLTLAPISYGNQTIRVRLYQDSSGGADWVDEKTKSVIVEKGYLWTQIESLNEKVASLETDNSRLNDMTNKLTYAVISLFIITFAVGITFWWISHRKQIV